MGVPSASAVIWLVDQGQYVRGLIRRRVTSAGAITAHWGLDVGAVIMTPARAVRAGRILSVGLRSGYGNTVAIRHSDDLCTVYGHLHSASVSVNQEVVPGDIVGLIGNTTAGPRGEPEWVLIKRANGWTMGMHLHWEVHPRRTPTFGSTDERLDPEVWLRENGVSMIRPR